VVIAAGLTLYAKHLLKRPAIRPNFLASANSGGAGKTLLWKIPIIALGGRAPAGTVPKDEDEMRKLIGAAALSGSPALFLDNVKGHLSSASLEALTTSPVTQFRLLGQNKLIEAEHGLTVFITANDATFSPDLRRRTLAVELFLSDLHPESRPIKHPLDDAELIKLRPSILGGFYAFVRHWDAQGRPRPKQINQSFAAWSEVVGGILEACNYVSPCAPSKSHGLAGDRDLIDMERLADNMVVNKAYEFAGLVELAQHHRCFEWIIGDTGDELDRAARKVFGELLKRFLGRYFVVSDDDGQIQVKFDLLSSTARKKYGITPAGGQRS
jgi:hypothetical protein